MLIENWRSAWRYITVQIGAAMLAFGALPVDQQSAILQAIGLPVERLTAVLGALVLVGRLVNQSKA